MRGLAGRERERERGGEREREREREREGERGENNIKQWLHTTVVVHST